jgi:hypothetical protein
MRVPTTTKLTLGGIRKKVCEFCKKNSSKFQGTAERKPILLGDGLSVKIL